MTTVVHNEILHVADTVAREKGISNEQVVLAMEEAVQKIGRAKYGQDNDIRAMIDRKTGAIRLERHRLVSEISEDATQMTLEEAQALDSTLKIGDSLVEDLPPVTFDRAAAQIARQIISQRVREAERLRQYEDFKDKVGEIISCVVKRAEFGNYAIDVGRGEALLRREETIPREVLRPGDKIRAYVMEVSSDVRGPQVLLSRSHPQFMAKLFQQEVPEIYDGTIEIVAVARDPGSRAKIAVRSKDSSIDPVGSCVGIRGSRVQAVVGELQGEKVDIIPWTADVPTFVINALAPATISKVIYDEESGRVEVVVPDDQQSIAIGRRGQNVRLASLLTGLDVSITSEADDYKKVAENFKRTAQLFTEALDVDETIANLLIAEGYESVEEIAEASMDQLLLIDGFDEGLAQELQQRAQDSLARKSQEMTDALETLGLDPALSALEGLSDEMLVRLGKSEIKNLDDLADLASDELRDIVGAHTLTEDEANALIMQARSHWFDESGNLKSE